MLCQMTRHTNFASKKHTISSDKVVPTDLYFDLEEMPYALEFRITGSEGKQRFEGKRVPYNSQLTVE